MFALKFQSIILISFLFVAQSFESSFSKLDLKEIKTMEFNKNKNIKSNSLKQLNCLNETNALCIPNYEPKKITCINKNYHINSIPEWYCDDTGFKNVDLKNFTIICESYEEDLKNDLSNHNCHLNYTLKLTLVNNSKFVFEAEAFAIGLFIILCLVVCIASGGMTYFYNQSDQPNCMQNREELRPASSISIISEHLMNDDTDNLFQSTRMSNYA